MRRSLLAVCLAAMVLPALAAGKADYTGFWKKNCEDPFGLQIKPQRGGLYAIAFCKGDGCTPAGAYRPDTTIENDPLYDILAATRIRVRDAEGTFSTYIKCTTETLPPLRQKF
jgi:hypothetical protein